MKEFRKTRDLVALVLVSLTMMACAGEKPKIEYRVVEQASGDADVQEIWVMMDGKLQNSGIEPGEIYEIIEQRDYDGDGLEEAYVAQSTGGSADLPPFIVWYDKEVGAFRKVEFNDPGALLSDKVEQWNGKWTFTAGSGSHGMRFVFEGGRIVKVDEYTRPQPDGAETLLSLLPAKMFGPEGEAEAGDTKTVSFDLDGDGRNEAIECEYMHAINWGDPERDYKPTMRVSIRWGNGQTTDLTGDDYWLRMDVLSTRTNGVNDLANGQRGVTFRWDGRRYKRQ